MNEMYDVQQLVQGVLSGDRVAWDRLVDRYLPLVMSVVRRYRLADCDAEDVSQTVWLRLIENLGSLREPRALPQWIVTTTKNEALRLLKNRKRTLITDPEEAGGAFERHAEGPELDAELLRSEREHALNRALLDGLALLPPDQRRLVLLCVSDPPVSYSEIAELLQMPIGSIGPKRARCLAKLRQSRPVREFWAEQQSLDEEASTHDITRLDARRR